MKKHKLLNMKSLKTPLSIKLIYWLTNFSFWVLTGLVGIIAMVNIIELTIGYNHSLQMIIQMPIPIEVNEIGIMHLKNQDHNVQIVDAYGKLKFTDSPDFVTIWVIRVMLLVSLIGWFILWRFKQFTFNIRSGKIFELDNINKLKEAAYGLVGLYVITRIYMSILANEINQHLDLNSVTLGSKLLDTDAIIYIAIILWALAHIFMSGIEMREEQELTI
jgi:hypothetical protein